MENALIGAVATLSGVITAGVISYFFKRQELRFQRMEDDRRFWFSRMEKFHNQVAELMYAGSQFTTALIRMRNSTLSDSEKYALFNEASNRLSGSVAASSSTQRIFVASIEKQWKEVLHHSQIVIKAGGQYGAGALGEKEFFDVIDGLNEACVVVLDKTERLISERHPQLEPSSPDPTGKIAARLVKSRT